jgi:predicted porin
MAENSVLSGYYDYRNIKNANNSVSGSAAGSLLPIGTVTQDVNKKLQAAGIALSMKPSEWINTTASLSWNRDDFSTYFLRSDRRRFEQPAAVLNFLAVDRPEYSVDTYVFALGGDWQVSDELRWNGGYTLSRSTGDTASGYVGSALTATAGSVDGRINTTVHSLALGVDYELKKNTKLKASYSYDYYDDKVYRALTGGVNALMLGVSFGF